TWSGLGGAAPPEPAAGGFASPFAPASPVALAAPAAPMGRFRILPAVPGGGEAPPGRSLAFYRARPIQRAGPLPALALRR
ncbi:MAG: hypothetical protein KGI51_15410, partial [Rhodospirillales bacterium]|nr:hypothetical protein [Rhodospirillales bacterium]